MSRAVESAGDGRIPALDGVRALAILMVIPHNGNLLPGGHLAMPAQLMKDLILNGWMGVQLFFVLSGFLISGVLLDSRNSATYYQSFYARRALRILPLYYGVLIVTFVILAPLQLLPAQVIASSHHQFWLWTFLSNWGGPLGYEVKGFAHFWSLAVEEQFYLLWPVLLHRMSPQRVVAFCLILCAAALAIRTGIRLAGGSDDYCYESTFCRMDALAMGAAAAALLRIPQWQSRLRQALPYLPWVALLILLAFLPFTHDYERTGLRTQTIGYTIVALAFTLLVLAASFMRADSRSWLARALCFAPLRSVGKYSYAMYVFHFPLHKLVGVQLLGVAGSEVLASPAQALLYALALIVASYLLGWASYHLYEKHFLQLKHRFPTRPVALEAA